jgi:hypothetical protein
MSRQTLRPYQWIVVDDGKTPLIPTPEMTYIRREPRPDDPKHTMILNMRAALQAIAGEKILFVEDDEYYAPHYVEEMARRLDGYEVVGIARSKYYHLPTGGFLRHSNMDHASLAQTGFRGSFLHEFATLLNGDMFLDIRIWKKVGNTQKLNWGEQTCVVGERVIGNGRGLLFDDGADAKLYVGMKGLPGRAGIGCGHREYREYLQDTPDREVLKRWIPEDYRFYMEILAGKETITEE